MKRILFFINHFPSSSETFIKDEIEFFKNAGFEVSVLCHSFKRAIPGVSFYTTDLNKKPLLRLLYAIKKLTNGGYITSRLSLWNVFKFGKNSVNQALSLVGDHFLTYQKYDIIYSHFGNNGKIVCELKEAGIIPKETKVVIHFHGLDLSTKTYSSTYYSILNKYCDKIIVGSDLAINQLKKLKVYDDRKVIKVPVSLDLTKFPEKDHHKGAILRITTVGRLIEWKGHLDAIEVAKEFKKRYRKPFKYTIIGEGELKSALNKLIVKYDLENEVILVGALSHDKIIDILYKSDLYLYCGIIDKNGRQEMQGLAIVEAMASNCIMVCSTVGGAKEYLNNDNALLCEPGDINGFVGNLLLALEDQKLAERLRKNARKTTLEQFDREENYRKLINFISSN